MKWILVNSCLVLYLVVFSLVSIYYYEFFYFPVFTSRECILYFLSITFLILGLLGVQHKLSEPKEKWNKAGWTNGFSTKPAMLQILFVVGWSALLIGGLNSTFLWYVYSDTQSLNSLVVPIVGASISFSVDVAPRLYKSRFSVRKN